MSTLKLFLYGALVASLAIGGTVYRNTASSSCSPAECDAGVSCCAQEATCSAENASSCGSGGCCAAKASACCASGETAGACPASTACSVSATCPATQHEQTATSDNVVAEVEQVAAENIADTATETSVEESPAGQ
jgi:hypothetical protein